MMTPFLPPLDSQWRLTADWMPPEWVRDHRDNVETLWGLPQYDFDGFTEATGIKTSGVARDWVPPYQNWRRSLRTHDGMIPKGTVIQIERYHISRSGQNQITLKVLASPKRQLTTKKRGGIMRGAGRLYLRLEDMNAIGLLEEVDPRI